MQQLLVSAACALVSRESERLLGGKRGGREGQVRMETHNPPSQMIAAMEALRRVGMCKLLMKGKGKQSTMKSKTRLMHATANANAE